MRSVAWRRSVLIERVRTDLWRYITPSASVESEVLEAAALLQMSSRDVRMLGAIQFLVSDELAAFLDYVPTLLRRLATTTAHEEEVRPDRIRGPIQWAQTIAHQTSTGAENVFVTAPSHRAYQTPENELVVFLLDQTVTLGKALGWDRSASEGVGETVRQRVHAAEMWNHSRMLATVERRAIDPRRLARIRQGRARRRYQPALDAWTRYAQLVGRLDRDSVRRAVETYGLVSRSDPTLLELYCLFECLRALAVLGWRFGRFGLFAGSVRVRGQRGHDQLEIVYQSTPRELSAVSEYGSVQATHGIPRSSLRPDLVIRKRRTDAPDEWLLVEVKGGTRAVEDSARAATLDLLAYRAAFSEALKSTPEPYGLGVAWGAQLEPKPGRGIMLCTPDTLELALSHLFGGAQSASGLA